MGSRGNCVLLLFCLIIFASLSIGLTLHNMSPDAKGAHSNLINLILGNVIAFATAAIAVGFDLQNAVNDRLGKLENIAVLGEWLGWLTITVWGLFDVVIFQVVLINPNWASHTLDFDVSTNVLLTAVISGLSAVLIIRSKLLKLGHIEWGCEWFYLWSSARVLFAVNRRRIEIKAKWERKLSGPVNDIAALPNFYTELEAHSLAIARGVSPVVELALTQECNGLRSKYPTSSGQPQDMGVNNNSDARRYLVSAVIDHLGHEVLKNWTKQAGIAIR